jgi:hypothetical protein
MVSAERGAGLHHPSMRRRSVKGVTSPSFFFRNPARLWRCTARPGRTACGSGRARTRSRKPRRHSATKVRVLSITGARLPRKCQNRCTHQPAGLFDGRDLGDPVNWLAFRPCSTGSRPNPDDCYCSGVAPVSRSDRRAQLCGFCHGYWRQRRDRKQPTNHCYRSCDCGTGRRHSSPNAWGPDRLTQPEGTIAFDRRAVPRPSPCVRVPAVSPASLGYDGSGSSRG